MTKKKNTVKCIQKNIIKHHNHEFTAAQIKEQKQFGIALKQNKAQITDSRLGDLKSRFHMVCHFSRKQNAIFDKS